MIIAGNSAFLKYFALSKFDIQIKLAKKNQKQTQQLRTFAFNSWFIGTDSMLNVKLEVS